VKYRKVLQIIAFVFLVIIASAMFVSKAWVSGICIAVAGGILHPATRINKAIYRWALVVVLILAGTWFIPDAVGNGPAIHA